VIYAERFGVIEAAKEKGILAISNMSDQSALGPDTVITGPVWTCGDGQVTWSSLVKAGVCHGPGFRRLFLHVQGRALYLAPYNKFEGKAARRGQGPGGKAQAEILAGTFRVWTSTSRSPSPVKWRAPTAGNARHRQALRDVQANDGVDLTLKCARSWACAGARTGPGKTTLMNISSGSTPRMPVGSPSTAGPCAFQSSADALAHGGRDGAPALPSGAPSHVLENLMVGQSGPRAAAGPRLRAHVHVRYRSGVSACQLPPDARVADLTIGEQQRLEIMKALYPRGAHPDPRRGPRPAPDPAGGRRPVRRPADDGRAADGGDLHQPQAARDPWPSPPGS